MPIDTQEILDFIQHFEDCQDTFSNDGGYWFAAILSQRFPGTICFDTEKEEFMARIDYRFYDATGECTERHRLSDIQTWEHMKQTGKTETKRVADMYVMFKDVPDTNPDINGLENQFGVVPGDNEDEHYVIMGTPSRVSGPAYKPFGRLCVGAYVIPTKTDGHVPTGKVRIAVWRTIEDYLKAPAPAAIIDIPGNEEGA